MTQHMLDFVRQLAERAGAGPVLEVGSLIEANQEHLDLRGAFPPGTSYIGVDVLDGPGVDRHADLLDVETVVAIAAEVPPAFVLCLYVVEHVFDIRKAFRTLGEVGQRHPEAWVLVASHQCQPFHGTARYGDFWRMTAEGLRRLLEEAVLSGARILCLGEDTNPSDLLAVRPPASVPAARVNDFLQFDGWVYARRQMLGLHNSSEDPR